MGFIPGLAAALPPSNRLIFDGDSSHIGMVRCPPTAPDFRETCKSKCYCFAFSRSAVKIRPSGSRPFIEDANNVSFYNQGQEYAREVVAPSGDRCEWYGVESSIVRDAVAGFDWRAAESERLFTHSSAPVPPALYLKQRVLFRRVRRDPTIDPLLVEETIVDLLNSVVQAAHPEAPCDGLDRHRAHEIADAAQSFLAVRFSSHVTLQALAAALETSVFHLCRVFRRIHGRTIHRYLLDLRLRRALDGLESDRADLAMLAERLGFSHHSHFTATFRTAFGAPPSEVRALLQTSPQRCA